MSSVFWYHVWAVSKTCCWFNGSHRTKYGTWVLELESSLRLILIPTLGASIWEPFHGSLLSLVSSFGSACTDQPDLSILVFWSSHTASIGDIGTTETWVRAVEWNNCKKKEILVFVEFQDDGEFMWLWNWDIFLTIEKRSARILIICD